MKRMLLTVTMFTVFLAAGANATGWLSRYWDGCKPSCSWSGNAAGNPCKECDKNNNKMNTSDANRNACENGGTSYTCWDMIPFQVDANTAYGFVATHPPNRCGTCYEITFNGNGQHGNTSRHTAIRGKKMIVMASNIGGDVQGEQLDLLVPGGGVGAFDAFSNQIGKSKSDLGQQYGGLLSDCESQGDVAGCLKSKCASVFSGQPLLKQGCDFYAEWLMAAGNPQFESQTVTCPQVLTEIYKGTRTGPGGGDPPPGGNTYTLTVNRNPTAGGTVTPASPQSNITAGTAVNITATPASANNYRFVNWTISGSGTLANANNASTSVTVNGNVTVTANFTTGTNPPPNPGGGDTTKIEAEAYTSKNGDEMRTETENGITCIGYIQNGYSTTYNNVNVSKSGAYTMEFRIALNQADVSSSSFTVTVNGQNVGTISTNGTGGWSTYQTVTLSSQVQLNQGSNTVVLNFGNAINVDWFQIIGEKVSVKFDAARTVKSARTNIKLTAGARSFTAALPANHGYSAYKLVDMRGRELRSGRIGDGVTSLKFNGLKNSVMLLRLEGKNASTVVKAVTY